MTDTHDNDERINAQVAFVLSNREVLLDKGIEEGVELGMRFVILGTTTVENSAGVSLRLSYPKGTVKIVRFENDGNNAVGRTFKTIKGRPALNSLASYAQNFGAAVPDRVATIRVDNSETLQDLLSPEDYSVIEGDVVRETRGDEYDD